MNGWGWNRTESIKGERKVMIEEDMKEEQKVIQANNESYVMVCYVVFMENKDR